MKNLLLASILVAFSFMAQAAANFCGAPSVGGDLQPQDRVPWPWGMEVSVPWKNISGTWEVNDGTCSSQFIFKVKTDQSGEKMVLITQFDANSCKVISQGLGTESNSYILAQMVHGGKSFNMSIHAFNESDLSPSSKFNIGENMSGNDAGGDKVILALSLAPVGRWDEKAAFELVKVSSSSQMVCN